MPKEIKKRKYTIRTETIFQKAPHLEREWDYEKNAHLDPKTINYGTMKKAWWICETCSLHKKSEY